MVDTKYREFKKIFANHHGILRASEAIRLGVPQYILYEMLRHRKLVKEGRGLYRLADAKPLGNPDLIQACLLIPKGVICLISALYFHRMTTQIPDRVYLALPNHIKKPRIDYPPLEVFWLLPIPYSAGMDEITIDGVKVRIYNREKTIVDCFKFRRRIGEEIALEALKDYTSGSQVHIHRLIEYARINRVEKILTPYLKSLL